MVNFNKNVASAQREAVGFDEGLRSYMIQVYNYMAGGLAVTGLIAMLAASSEGLMQAIFGTPLQWVVMLAPLGLVFFLSFKINSMSFQAAQATFWIYAGLMGLSLSFIFLVYTGESIARIFFITAAVFGGMSLYGYTTKRDLTAMGSFLIMGLIGVILASIVNIFLKSSGLQFAVSILSVLIFTGLTAYDTQRIKQTYYAIAGAGESLGKAAIMGALALYLDFINLFIQLLHLFGQRR